jgi:preprotein translocase subunit SecA
VRESDDARLDQRWQAREVQRPAAPVPAAMAAMQRGRERAAAAAGSQGPTKPIVRDGQRVGRNDACPCGSGKKYKRCCSPKFD